MGGVGESLALTDELDFERWQGWGWGHSRLRAQHTCMGTGGRLVGPGHSEGFHVTPGAMRERGLISHPAGGFVLSTIPDPMRSEALHVIMFRVL